MVMFSEEFYRSKCEPIQYKGKIVHSVDLFPAKNGDILTINIESAKNTIDDDGNKIIQGLSVGIEGSCVMNGELFEYKRGKRKFVNMLFFDDTAPKPVSLKLIIKDTSVCIKNIWEVRKPDGKYTIESRIMGAAMLVDEIENGRRYRCNDYQPNDDFDDIIFTIKKNS